MAPALLACLPTMQLVCSCLVATGNSSNGGTSLTNATELRSTTPALSLPSGYVAYPDFGFAFKVHDDLVSWYTASARCAQDGGYLAIADSFAKIELVKKQRPNVNSTLHVGFQLMDGSNSTWYSVKTGLSVAKLPWVQGEPRGDGLCATIRSSDEGLSKFPCTTQRHYVCEIPYP